MPFSALGPAAVSNDEVHSRLHDYEQQHRVTAMAVIANATTMSKAIAPPRLGATMVIAVSFLGKAIHYGTALEGAPDARVRRHRK